MYCKKCGQYIGTDADTCAECLQKEAQPAFTYQPAGTYQSPINLGKAIAAMILSFVGFIWAYVTYIYVLTMFTFASADVAIITAIVLTVLGIVPSIIGLVFGCNSISNFKQTKYIRSGKRIPLLILGISAVVEAAPGLLFAFFTIFFAAIYAMI